MPRFPKGFGRRRSTANDLEDGPNEPVASVSSFKVFERKEIEGGPSKSFDGGSKFARAVNGHMARPNTSHLEGDNMFEKNNRGSGASNTNTASTTDNSSRLSAASTAPSSHEEYRDSHGRAYADVPLPPIPKSSTAFSLKNAGRAMSWTRHKNGSAPSPPKESHSPVTIEEELPSGRARAVTTSSYASTATPPKLNSDKDLGLSLGGDFGDMFSGFGKRRSQMLDANETNGLSHSPETTQFSQPAHLTINGNAEVGGPIPSPYSVDSQHSNDALIRDGSPPPVPQHNSTMPFSRPQRPGGPPDGLRRSSGGPPRRRSTVEYSDAIDEDARLLRESVNASRRMNDRSRSRPRDNWVPSTSRTPDGSSIPSWRASSNETTPRARKPVANPANLQDEELFDNHMYASANAAQRFQENSQSPSAQQTSETPQSKVMTPAQFERYRQDQDRLKMIGGKTTDDEEDDEEEINYDDDEDEIEKNRELAKQRRKQEAHMAVYRQQMMKVTGEQASPAANVRSSVFASLSSPNISLTLGKSAEDEEEDEEIPLAILQAHGFPNKNKPLARNSGSNPNLRGAAQSTAGGVVDPRLPVFARHLPEDPYFGAGIVNHAPRESVGFNAGGGSVAGGATPRGAPPGGLVGVIASEERSRAARRGSPNPQGEYPPVPPMGFNGPGGPIAAGSMPNGLPPGMVNPMAMGPMGQMPMMPMLTPGDQAQIQMTQQMQQFMQMQMQFMQMMTNPGQAPASPQMGQTGAPQLPPMNGHMSHQSLHLPGRPASPQLFPNSQQRAMTMMDANAAPWMQQSRASMYAPSIHAQGLSYAPSIAPSERSNIGLPGRYRPVSKAVNNDNKSRTSTMSGALGGGWNSENKAPGSTIRAIQKSNLDEEDDEEGWEEMVKKREKKKSIWRTKKGSSNGLKDMLGYTTH